MTDNTDDSSRRILAEDLRTPSLFEPPTVTSSAQDAFIPILSYGMGVESTAILLRWLDEPDSRDFALTNLIVVVAMTGDEWSDTRSDVEGHVLPRLREQKVRLVQVARAGHLEKDGIAILDDSREPEKLHIEGAYKLSDELKVAGMVPAFSGQHKCSLKFKAWVIDSWLEQNVYSRIRHTFGYNADELGRVAKCDQAMTRITFGFNADEQTRVRKGRAYDGPNRIGHYPLVELGWDRLDCFTYIKDVTGAEWQKSACVYCPFAKIDAAALARQKQFPKQVADALVLERVSLAMNPRGRLYKKEPLYKIVFDSGNEVAVNLLQKQLDAAPWGVYRVRRIYQPKAIYSGIGKSRQLVGYDQGKKGIASRCVEKIAEFSKEEEALRHLDGVAQSRDLKVTVVHELSYATVTACGRTYPTSEEYFVAAPAVVDTKARYGVASFDQDWDELADLYCGQDDLPPLLAIG